MVILRIKLNNILAFKNFEVNFGYSRKLNKSLIEGEYLKTVPSFRYKKLIVLIGSNASGKTSLIKALWRTTLFLNNKDESKLDDILDANNKDDSQIELDFANEFEDKATLFRTKIRITYDRQTNARTVGMAMYSKKLSNGDSYENCIEELDAQKYDYMDWKETLKDFPTNFGWNVVLPSTEKYFDHVTISDTNNEKETKDYYNILNNVMKTLDPSIIEVSKSLDSKDAIAVKFKNREPILIQTGHLISGIPFLSSGTKYGIQISNILYAIKNHQNGLYLVDEQFSYVTSDIEVAILTTMTSLLGSEEQLFFTTHNSNILDLRFPFHSFYFMKKTMIDGEALITISCASDLENRNNVSPKNMFDNDAFAAAPDVDKIYSLGDKENE